MHNYCRKPASFKGRWMVPPRIGPDRIRPTITKKHDVVEEGKRFELTEKITKDETIGQSPESIWDTTLLHLRRFASSGDEQGFSRLVRLVRWADRSALDFITVIQLALEAGSNLESRNLAQRALQHYPDDDSIQRYARILAPPEIVMKRKTTGLNVRLNREWLITHAGEYPGKWVALREGTLIATADSLRELIGLVGDTTNVLLTRAY